MLLRRGLFLLLVLLVMAGLFALAVAAMRPAGWTGFELLALIALAGNLPWLAISAANALIGLFILLLARDPAAVVLPALRRLGPGRPSSPTAIAVCIRHEDMSEVLPPLRRLMAGLPAGQYTLWFLSDSSDPAAIAAEEAAIATFPGARYRRRLDNRGFKAGNLMDFLDHHAGEARFVICLDADSEMTPAAVERLVALMEADDRLAIVQQLIVGRPAAAAFPRLFQFGMRAGMRAWATGQAFWQGPDGPYWGHNAILRVSAFRAHARLPSLPDGSAILSHDQVEAVRLHAAGWKVMVLPIEEGSLEGNPPALPEFMARDRRWGAGNMQYARLIAQPGLTWMGRWQLLQAMLLFTAAPCWLLLLFAAVGEAATGGAAGTDGSALFWLILAGWACHYAPKLAGYAEVLAKPALARRYGGRGRFARGALAEILFTTLLEPVSICNKSLGLLQLAGGGLRGWAAQNRRARGVAWGDAARLLWPQGLIGLACFVLTPPAAWPWLAPWAGPLLLAIPFCVATADPRFSAWLAARGIAATPEELARSGEEEATPSQA
ncbi:MAG: glucans biosynthesis glucosyltransferase MdoH [Rhodovarius sp.]|nr:glucans biosynthesis glucosyltransferase MdoH [Rhodovarius sp.]MDW8315281.1 glucans biosynthesis glucosyltransferase MdoH [Rhodovarius sp.]